MLVFLVVGQALAAPSYLSIKSVSVDNHPLYPGMSQAKADKLCGVCVSFMGQFINQLLNIILSKAIPRLIVNNVLCDCI